MARYSLVFGAALALTFAALTTIRAQSTTSPEEIKAICETAAKRYKTLDIAKEAPKGTVIVLMYKYTFCPIDLTVKAGSTVRWVNVDKRTSHSVWFKVQGQKESERKFPEEFHEMKFEKPGKFPYICGPHGDRENMRGTVTVTK